MKKYIIYGAILYLAAYFGDKQYGSPLPAQSSIIKTDSGFLITVLQTFPSPIKDTVNISTQRRLATSLK